MATLDKLSESLIFQLQVLELLTPLPAYLKLNKRMFKYPNKEAFYGIYCYLMSFMAEIDVLGYCIGCHEQIERKLRSSIKSHILKINQKYRFAKLSSINESLIIAPHGHKVVTFLLNLAEFIVSHLIVTKYGGRAELFSQSSDIQTEKLYEFEENLNIKISEIDEKIESQNIDIDVLASQIKELHNSIEKKKEIPIKKVDALSFVSEETKIHLKSELPDCKALNDLIGTLDSELKENEKILSREEELEEKLNHLLSLVDQIKNNNKSLDGKEVFDCFGSMAITTYAKSHNIELFKNELLSLRGVLQVGIEGYENFKKNIEPKVKLLVEKYESVQGLSEKLLSQSEKMEEIKKECFSKKSKYDSILDSMVSKFKEECHEENPFENIFVQPSIPCIPEYVEDKSSEKSFELFLNNIIKEGVPLRNSIIPSDSGNENTYIQETAQKSTISSKSLEFVKVSLGLIPNQISPKRLDFLKPWTFQKNRKGGNEFSKYGTPIKSEERRVTLASPKPTYERKKINRDMFKPSPLVRKVLTSSPKGDSLSHGQMESLKEVSAILSPEEKKDCNSSILLDILAEDLPTLQTNDRKPVNLRRRSLSECPRRRSINSLIADYKRLKNSLNSPTSGLENTSSQIGVTELNSLSSHDNFVDLSTSGNLNDLSIPENLDDSELF